MLQSQFDPNRLNRIETRHMAFDQGNLRFDMGFNVEQPCALF
jgi:hypothetical protein